MIARDALLTALALLLLIVGGLWLAGAGHWSPAAIVGAGLVAALFERRGYARRSGGRPGPGWHLSGESAIDPDTGELIRVWIDGETGARREARSDPPLN